MGPATGSFSQILRLLEAAAAGPGPLDDSLARAEQELARLQGEQAAAATELQAAETVEALSKADATTTRTALDGIDGVLAANPAPAPIPVAEPEHKAAGPSTGTTVARRPAKATVDPLAGLRSEQLRLGIQLQQQLQTLSAAGQGTAAARDRLSAKTAEVEGAGRSVEDLRKQVWAKLNDPTFASAARVLVADKDGKQAAPSTLARADVPGPSIDLYRQAAATCPGLSWTVLAAIGSIESDHGRLDAAGVRSGANFAGAMGPMQFLAGTWAAYGVDGNGDGNRNVYDGADAVPGAAKYLCANGAGSLTRLADALWNYNHAGWYVDDVLALALRYGSDGLAPAAGTAADVPALLNQPNLVLTPEARADLAAGVVDARLVRMLAAASAGHRIAVSVIQTGHSMLVAGTDRVSNHFYGRGVDIYAVDGVNVSSTNNAALEVALAVLMTTPELRPTEFGSPWPELAAFPGAFSDADHVDHLHLGWGSLAPAPTATQAPATTTTTTTTATTTTRPLAATTTTTKAP